MEELGVPVTLLGKYHLGSLVGCGSFAKVYHARDLRTGESVAIKVVSRRKVVEEGLVGHIKREISIMRQVRHPHVVKLLEVLATRTKIFFVMEFAMGGVLVSKLSNGRLSEDLSRRYFQQLITAVGYCHARGVFHRDLKLENLLLDKNWKLKVSDFGLSAMRDQIKPDGLLHTLCGTPAYVAPEVISKRGYDGAKVDVWSCGVILFALVAGYLPFNAHNLVVLYRKILSGDYRCPKWTSLELRHFMSRLLDTNPDTRITVEGILKDAWFGKDYDQVVANVFVFDEFDLKLDHDANKTLLLNAFDIISLSSGLDLSGLVRGDSAVPDRSERFLSSEAPTRILERVEEVAEGEGLEVTERMEWGAKLEGYKGNSAGRIIVIEIDRLTEELVVVHVRERKREEEKGHVELSQDVWKYKLRPRLDCFAYDDERLAV